MSHPAADANPARRGFLRHATAGCLALALPPLRAVGGFEQSDGSGETFDALSRDLLRDWCDGMLAVQIHDPARPAVHGALDCPACDFIHGRCMDAVYPFLHMAKVTGQAKYLDAGIAVFEWSKNVSQEDGSWTVIDDPRSWKGITVFGAIALADTLHHHGELLDDATRQRWRDRLVRAGDYLFKTFTTLDFSNINYGCSGAYGMHLLGRVLDRPAFVERGRELASRLQEYVSHPSGLLVGEGKPAKGRSPRGCRPVDLGYNVEESLVSLALFAEVAGDPAFKATVTKLLHAHLEFMLPDGGWDNSWGTRHAKWTYWGSRTCDGCQPGYAVFAAEHPVFATAVVRNTLLARNCTARGLLHGGPHCVGRGVKPCVHHTFTHAKALTAVRDRGDLAKRIQPGAPLPRAVADGVREYPEIATWLVARGPWRATVTASDWIYREGVQQPTGGVISLLWHQQVGPLVAGSMARYELVEKNNMQANPEPEDHPLTPRVELQEDGTWFTQLYDPTAKVECADEEGRITFSITTRLRNARRETPSRAEPEYSLVYRFERETVMLAVRAAGVGAGRERARLLLPLISPAGEPVDRRSDRCVEIRKPGGTVVVEANAQLLSGDDGRPRIFNLVPGIEAVPIIAEIPADSRLECRIRVKRS